MLGSNLIVESVIVVGSTEKSRIVGLLLFFFLFSVNVP